MTGPITASAVYPVTRRFIGVAKEATPGTVVAPTFTFPMTKFTPKDNITYLKDSAWRNAMAALYNLIQGVEIGDLDMEGPFFGDGIGYPLVNILGDYWQSVNGTAATATTLASNYTAGGTTISVTSAANISNGTTFAVGALGTTAEEVRTATNVVSTTVTLNAPMYQNHSSTVAVTPYSAVNTYVHNFSLLNNGLGAGGWTVAQPQTQTWTDYTGVTASVGARNYAYTCFSELSMTGTATALLMWDGKATAFASAIAGSTPTATISAVKPQAAWESTLSIGGSAVSDITEWKCTIKRKLDPKFTNSGQQTPFAIPRGELDVALSLMYDPAVDESGFLEYLNNTQPTIAITAGNGGSGAGLVQVVLNVQVGAYDTGELDDSKTTFGYNTTQQAVANTTNAGPSGGYSPISVALTNGVVNY
jgi:Phage tail tube protein